MSLALRLGGGEPLFGLPPLIPYPELAANLLPIDAAGWYDESGALLFPFKTLAAATGLVLLPLVSRLTCRVESRRGRCGTCARAPYLYATAALDGPARWITSKRVNPTSLHQPRKSAPE